MNGKKFISAAAMTVLTILSAAAAEPPFRVGVPDFVTIDAKGQKKFLDYQNKPIRIPQQESLDKGDRIFMSRTMQGFVRLVDAWSSFRTGDANRTAQIRDNEFNRAKALELYRTAVNGPSRPAVIGAEYLAAELGKHGDVFGVVETSAIESAVRQLQAAPDFPKDVMQKLQKATGTTHLLCGTVSDMRSRIVTFRGYGIETRAVIYELDLIVRMTDLASGSTVHSGVYTGTLREDMRHGAVTLDSNKFALLIKSAAGLAAEDLYTQCRSGRKNTIPASVRAEK